MPLMTRIPYDLAEFGLKVELVPGWETRSAGSFAPAGVVCHWTAGPVGTTGRPSLNVVVNGRPDLPGPLCNIYFDRQGTCVVVAAGRANHAGVGGARGLVGNSAVYGIEAECGGDGDWTPAQRKLYPRLVAALLHGLGRDASYTIGHNEWAPTRKPDIRDIISEVRSGAADILSGSQEDFMAALSDEQQVALYEAVMGMNGPGRNNFNYLDDRIKSLVQPLNDCRAALIGGNAGDLNNFHWLGAQIAALTAAVQANASEGGLSSDQITAAAKAGADQALAELGRRLPPA